MLRSLGFSTAPTATATAAASTIIAGSDSNGEEETEQLLLAPNGNANFVEDLDVVFDSNLYSANPSDCESSRMVGGVFDLQACDHRVLIYTTCYNVIDG